MRTETATAADEIGQPSSTLLLYIFPIPNFQYIVAVYGMDSGSRKNLINLVSASGNNLDELPTPQKKCFWHFP